MGAVNFWPMSFYQKNKSRQPTSRGQGSTQKGGALKRSSLDDRGTSGRGGTSPWGRGDGHTHHYYLRSLKSVRTNDNEARSARRFSFPLATPNQGARRQRSPSHRSARSATHLQRAGFYPEGRCLEKIIFR